MKTRWLVFLAVPAACVAAAVVVVGQGPPPPEGGVPPESGGASGDRRAEFVRRLDKNGDGTISAEEREAARQAGGRRRGGAGKAAGPFVPDPSIRNDEAMQKLQERFDTNGNGRLDYEEMAALRENRRERRGPDQAAEGSNSPPAEGVSSP